MSSFLLVISCQAYRHRQEQFKSRFSQLLGQPSLEWVVVEAQPSLEQPFLYDEDNHRLTVRTGDGYLDLPKKLFSAFMWLNHTRPSANMVKVDDDYGELPSQVSWLEHILKQPPGPTVHYTGLKWVDVPKAKRDITQTCLASYYLKGLAPGQAPLFPSSKGKRKPQNRLVSHDGRYQVVYSGGWYDGGSGYYLSAQALLTILRHYNGDPEQIKEIYEDKCWGDCLRLK